MSCRMAGCDGAIDQLGLCARHLLRFVHEPLWVPVAVVPAPDGEPGANMTLCGLCATPVWAFPPSGEKYISDTSPILLVLERDARPGGDCRIVDGGYTTVHAKERPRLVAAGIPLYWAHAPRCARRPRPMEVVL